MARPCKRRVVVFLLFGAVMLLLAGCADTREIGRQVGVLTRQLAILVEQFTVGFFEGCCAGAVVAPGGLILLSVILGGRRL